MATNEGDISQRDIFGRHLLRFKKGSLLSVIVLLIISCLSYMLGFYIGNKSVYQLPEFSRIASRGRDYSYLAIGNSITLHYKTEFWWNECGMAASKTENDYYHIVLEKLEDIKGKKVNSQAVAYSAWELMADDRSETYYIIDDYLVPQVDLITIQLGENAKYVDTFEIDFEALIHHIQNKCPNAQIIVIGDFWKFVDRDEIKKRVSKKAKVEFIDLSMIRENPDYMAGVGSVVYDERGVEHSILHEGVAKHPNDKGMAFIARKILNVIK